MDKQTLKTKYPQVYQQAKKEGKKEVTENARQEGRKEAQQQFIQAARTILGEGSAQALEQAIETGLTGEQLKKARELLNKGGSAPGTHDGKANEILQGLLNAEGHSGLSPRSQDGDNPLVQNAKDRNQGGEENEQSEQ